MSAYALPHLREIDPHPEILEYLEKIQTTLDPFCGRFIVHGGAVDVREGTWRTPWCSRSASATSMIPSARLRPSSVRGAHASRGSSGDRGETAAGRPYQDRSASGFETGCCRSFSALERRLKSSSTPIASIGRSRLHSQVKVYGIAQDFEISVVAVCHRRRYRLRCRPLRAPNRRARLDQFGRHWAALEFRRCAP